LIIAVSLCGHLWPWAAPPLTVRAQADHVGGLKADLVIEGQGRSVATIGQQLLARQPIGSSPVRDLGHQ